MNINKQVFESNPTRLDISRSKHDLSHGWQGTFVTGKAIPILGYSDVLPGDTFKLSASCVIRSTTPVAPVMDNAFADVFFFFVPNDLILSRQSMSPSVNDSNRSWKAFIGAQDSLLNMPLPAEVELPSVSFGSIGESGESNFETGSLADYLGYPDFGTTPFPWKNFKRRTNVLEALAYYSVWNNYFRDPNTMEPVVYSIFNSDYFGGSHPTIVLRGFGLGDGYSDIGHKASVMPVCRFHGYFGSALPWPQRNSDAVTLPLGDTAPLVAGSDVYSVGRDIMFGPNTELAEALANDGTTWKTSASGPEGYASGTNLRVDLSQATAASVNALRLAVQTQRWYEALARGGNRIGELTSSMFGVTPSDAASDRPEYLGGKRIMINVQQVNNTAGTNISTETQQSIGSTGAYSLSTDDDFYFTKSFDKWGSIIGIVCVRTAERYHQGLARRHSRFSRFDFYWPQFANLGEQAIKNKEIYMDGSVEDDFPFGYQEAWAEYRFFPDVTTGLCRPGKNQAYWNYTNNFDSRPNLKDFLNAESQVTNVDRTLQVPSTSSGFQWIADFHFDITAVRPMPTHSIPGLVDHH